jgi:hypothetical protein
MVSISPTLGYPMGPMAAYCVPLNGTYPRMRSSPMLVGGAAVLVVRNEHERWVGIAANAGECLPLLPETPFLNTKLLHYINTPLP